MSNAPRVEPEPRAQPIKIKVNKGDFIYEPALLHANGETLIRWRCDDGDFTVSFPERTPFDRITIQGSQGKLTEPVQFRPDADPGVYHYHVAVAVPTSNEKAKHRGEVTIFVDSGCPGVANSPSG